MDRPTGDSRLEYPELLKNLGTAHSRSPLPSELDLLFDGNLGLKPRSAPLLALAETDRKGGVVPRGLARSREFSLPHLELRICNYHCGCIRTCVGESLREGDPFSCVGGAEKCRLLLGLLPCDRCARE